MSGNDGSYSTSADNTRVYRFTIQLFMPLKGQYGDAVVERAMDELVDSVLNDFDRNYYFDGLSVPTGYQVMAVRAVPSKWGYTQRESWERVAEVEISAECNIDINLIT